MALLLLGAGLAGAQAPVRESTAAAPAARAGEAVSRVEAATPGDAARLGELFHRLQVLEQEARQLRGLVDEQAFQIERLTKQQKEQYIDLDQRLLAMRAGAPPEAGASPRPSTPSRPRPGGSSALPEREAYANAFNRMKELTKAGRFQEAADGFNRLLADYPNGQYAANAFYWLGELHLNMEEVELARQSFAQVVAVFPEHSKVPDALYKLGVAHHLLNDNERSLAYLRRVIAEHPDSSAAGLARTYAAELE